MLEERHRSDGRLQVHLRVVLRDRRDAFPGFAGDLDLDHRVGVRERRQGGAGIVESEDVAETRADTRRVPCPPLAHPYGMAPAQAGEDEVPGGSRRESGLRRDWDGGRRGRGGGRPDRCRFRDCRHRRRGRPRWRGQEQAGAHEAKGKRQDRD